jgi:ribulose-phosphate 3-epimerase
MVERPSSLVDAFLDAGANMVTVHQEAGADVPLALRRIRDRGRAAGLAVRLETPIEAIGPHLNEVDLVVLMGTALGVKGADLAPEAEGRIASLRLLLSQHGRHEQVKIEADGGLRRHTVPQLRAVGAQLISPGSLVFGSHDLRETFGWLRSLPSKLEGYGTP